MKKFLIHYNLMKYNLLIFLFLKKSIVDTYLHYAVFVYSLHLHHTLFISNTVNSAHSNTIVIHNIDCGSLHSLFADLIMEYNWPCNCHKNGQVYLTLQYYVNQNNATISLFWLCHARIY